MKDKEMAEQFADGYATPDLECSFRAYMFEASKDGFLAGLKAGRPQWHDLRKDPNDLPDEGSYLVVWQNARGYRERMIMKYEEDDEEELHWFDDENDCWDDDIIAWCEIPAFDKE